MSMSEAAYYERKWGRYPSLRTVLELKKIPDSYYGLTSASDNMFDFMDRLIEIAVLAIEFENDVKEAAKSLGREEMCKDIMELDRSLEWACDFFRDKGEKIRRISEEIRSGD